MTNRTSKNVASSAAKILRSKTASAYDKSVAASALTQHKRVPDRLKDLGNLFEERNRLYGDNYKHFGKVLQVMFPNGITLKTEHEFNEFALFIQLVHKNTRIAKSLQNGQGAHADSLDDLSVYAQMLAEVDDASND